MAIKKSELYTSLWKSCDELRGGMDAAAGHVGLRSSHSVCMTRFAHVLVAAFTLGLSLLLGNLAGGLRVG